MTAFHHLVVGAFLLLYAYKIGLLLAGRTDLLNHLRARAPWLDGVLGAAVLGTGGYLALTYAGAWPGWLTVKLGLVLAGLPLVFVALRRGRKALAALSLALFGYVYAVGYTRSLDLSGRATETPTTPTNPGHGRLLTPVASTDTFVTGGLIGKLTYKQNCIRCHGRNGDMCLYGARNLQQSTMTLDARIALISQGRGRMPAFYPRLTPEQIGAVARHSLTLFKADSATVARRHKKP